MSSDAPSPIATPPSPSLPGHLVHRAVLGVLAGDDAILATACKEMLAGDVAEHLATLFHALAAAHSAYVAGIEGMGGPDPTLCTLGAPEVALRALDALDALRPPLPDFYRAVAARLFTGAVGESAEVEFGIVLGDTLALGVLVLSGLLLLWAPGQESEALAELRRSLPCEPGAGDPPS